MVKMVYLIYILPQFLKSEKKFDMIGKTELKEKEEPDKSEWEEQSQEISEIQPPKIFLTLHRNNKMESSVKLKKLSGLNLLLKVQENKIHVKMNNRKESRSTLRQN